MGGMGWDGCEGMNRKAGVGEEGGEGIEREG